MKQILTLYPNPYDNDTMAKLVIDGLEHTKNVNVVEHDYSKAIYTKEELIEISKEVDYIFVFWTKRTYRFVNETYTYESLDAINRPDIVVYIDGSEYTSTGYHAPNQNWESLKKDPLVNRGEPWINEEMYKRCNWYFKREVYDIDLDRKKIVPLLVGALSSYDHNKQTLTSKQYDMFSSFGQVWTGLRSETEQLCSMLKNEGFNNIIGRNFPLEQYMNYIINSYIGISAWGAGNSCRRMWEIMSNKTCCFVQKKQILFPPQKNLNTKLVII